MIVLGPCRIREKLPLSGCPDILEEERDDRLKVPDQNISERCLRFDDIPHMERRFDGETLLVGQVNCPWLPVNTVNYEQGFTPPNFLFLA